MNIFRKILYNVLRAQGVSVGGQAVIEGVMMRSPISIATAIRRADNGIIVKKSFVLLLNKRYPLLGLPIVRGVVNLIQSLIIGVRSLNYSASIALEDIEKEEGVTDNKEENGEIGKVMLTITMLAAMVIGVLLFIALPLFLTGLVKASYPILENSLIFNSTDGLFRILIFLTYIISISFIKDIKRIFQYHGAEHKAVFCYESGEELTIANCKKFSTLHPRCGTNFLLIVMFISIFCFTFFPVGLPFYKKFLYRFVLIPLIGGVSYEIIRYGGRNQKSRVGKVIALGLMLQKITTKEPTDDQQEVALHALKDALEMEGEYDAGKIGVS